MAEEYENWYRWYEGTPSTFEPGYGELFTGYRMSAERLGDTTNPSTANQLSLVSEKLRQGMKTIEMGTISPDVFESIPKQHFKQMADLAKLTGAEVTVHSPFNPTIDMIGLDERGSWSESNREEAERRMLNVIERSHDLNPKGNVPVTIHATMAPTGEWTKEGRESLGVINPETGEFGMIKGKKHLYPGMTEPKQYTPEKELEVINESTWANQLTEIESSKREVETYLRRAVEDYGRVDKNEANLAIQKINEEMQKGLSHEEAKEKVLPALQDKERNEYLKYEDAILRVENAQRAMASEISAAFPTLMTKAYNDEEHRELLIKAGKEYNELMKQQQELSTKNPVQATLVLNDAQNIMLKALEHSRPKIYEKMEDFAQEKASETISDVAFKAFDKFKDSTPIIAVENVYPNVAFGRAEQLKELIEESRKKFVEKAVEKGIGREKAKETAEKLIGATWDIGHISMLKGAGYRDEFIVQETKKIAPFIKKVHMTDNFGFADTHLAPGMGEVVTKRHMKEMEKGNPNFQKIKTIAELGGLYQHFKVPSAYPYALEAMGSPMYSPTMAPYWGRPNRMSLSPEAQGGYFAPIPSELGGTTQKKQYTTEQ